MISPAPMEQDIRFVTADDGARLACVTSGSGMPLVKSAHWMTHLGHDWDNPIWHHQFRSLSERFRLLRYDQRGCGLSDRDVGNIDFEAWVRDLERVVDDAGLNRFVLLGMSQGGSIAIEYAARHPDRVSHLVLYGSYLRGRRYWNAIENPDLEADTFASLVQLGWGRENPAFRQVFSSLFIPGANADQVARFNELQRLSASPETAARIVSVNDRIDVLDSARRLQVPTLVMHCLDDARIPFEEGRRLSSEIPGARLVPLAGRNHMILEGEPAWEHFLEELVRFTSVDKAEMPAPPRNATLPEDLTSREGEVLALLATGLDNASIASQLGLTPKTVRNYLTRILDKLGVSSRGEAIVAARRAGLGVSRPER